MAVAVLLASLTLSPPTLSLTLPIVDLLHFSLDRAGVDAASLVSLSPAAPLYLAPSHPSPPAAASLPPSPPSPAAAKAPITHFPSHPTGMSGKFHSKKSSTFHSTSFLTWSTNSLNALCTFTMSSLYACSSIVFFFISSSSFTTFLSYLSFCDSLLTIVTFSTPYYSLSNFEQFRHAPVESHIMSLQVVFQNTDLPHLRLNTYLLLLQLLLLRGDLLAEVARRARRPIKLTTSDKSDLFVTQRPLSYYVRSEILSSLSLLGVRLQVLLQLENTVGYGVELAPEEHLLGPAAVPQRVAQLERHCVK